ncbi:arabinan endo-1,5-alpha-L-arabinosidase [Streptoalloteichus tenebrarius]|uniref:Arabinan endo-1,5-alpha-L-arabinosidase n=1 Tax=Streptoalloteichus tenebrarius (strain ATCC 17920 / DSM 40477 / JCM 4838 / CBS 697.72 / NBRC 16177 / NCIMB 11028 / NRRL B-12390 / A12253. 1 / ISP 5477) TaxID=1933 RepID=A0ABT1HS30_STRSD|nr:arabinan endo-1,5-alpha-L-arabinosidase [Streptoalloteichus tenebrarius]MCP2258324.1 arabinan endo-1,5-alpha-L-arabinosidase [Streptoalloteichus tenebrarius]BFF03490.1 arabinan endo-1,5-alpha-L-arabinosidase [Streptoalloteichus tenebrarius]
MAFPSRSRTALVALFALLALLGAGPSPVSALPSLPPSPGAGSLPSGGAPAPPAAQNPPHGPSPNPQYPFPRPLTGDIRVVHDPTMARVGSQYVVYSTNEAVRSLVSDDGVDFRIAGRAFAQPPAWWQNYNATGVIWAPDLSQRDDVFLLYYSVSSWGSNNSAIGLATSDTGLPGSWRDHGIVFASSGGDDFNAIDPSLLVDAEGRWWLVFGSFHTGIYLISVDPETGMQSTTDRARHNLARRGEGGAIEAPVIVERNGWYYLFVSFDTCCAGASSTYRIMVGRSASPTGPYVDRSGTPMLDGGGTEVLASHDWVIGPGGQSVLREGDQDLLVYHYYHRDDNGTPYLGTNVLEWDDEGWPRVV